MNPQRTPRLAALAKHAAPHLSALAYSTGAYKALPYIEFYTQIIQGKGSGSGWGRSGEAVAAYQMLSGTPSPVVIDAGANVGEWTHDLNRLLDDPTAHFLLIEPQPHCVSHLRKSRFSSRTTIVESALGRQQGSMQLRFSRISDPAASLFLREPQAAPETLDVVTRTLDGILLDFGIELVDFLKLDVEGAELAALQGASQALEGRRIRNLSFEFGEPSLGSRATFHDIWRLLTEAGFTIGRVLPHGEIDWLAEYSPSYEHYVRVSNYVATLQRL